MLELLVWLSKIEAALAGTLSPVVQKGRRPDAALHLKKVVAGKRKLSRTILSTASRIKAGPMKTPLVPGLKHLREDMDSSLSFLAEAIESGMDGAELAEAIAFLEYFKWNSLFLTLANIMKEGFPEAVPMLARAQRHKKSMETFLELQGSNQGLFRLRASDPVWRERFLLIGQVCPAVEEGLKRDGIVETISHGRDAIDRLSERYYGALIADEELPDLAGIELCRKASRMFPGIEERFLFLYGGIERKGRRPTAGRKPRRLHRGAPREKILEEVGLILDR